MITKTTSKKLINDIVSNFKKTGKYSMAFLRDLKDGLSDLQKSKLVFRVTNHYR